MRAGSLRHRLTIQTASTGRDSFGAGDQGPWIDDKTIWGGIWPLSGNEYFNSQQVKSNVSHKLRIRYTTLSNGSRITSKNRIKYNSDRYFNIISIINPDERNIYLDLMCNEDV